MDALIIAQITIAFSIPIILFARPKFIRDFFGDGSTPIVLGIISLIAMAIQIALAV